MADDRTELDALARAWTELLEQYQDEIGRRPTPPELAEVLSWALRALDGVAGYGPGAWVSAPGRPARGSRVDELNDAVFVMAADLVDLAADALSGVSGRTGAQAVLDLLADAYARAGGEPVGWSVRGGTGSTVRVKIGDVVAVPIGRGQYRYAVVVARNSVGTAVGILDAGGPMRPYAGGRGGGRPLYVGMEAVSDGTWPVVGHDRELAAQFDPEPEFFHEPNPDDPAVGPYGSAERPTGELRELSREEAEDIGLLDGSYVVGMLPREFEALLRSLD